jgi:glycosyltransferase involved in cell wall biosynthesis
MFRESLISGRVKRKHPELKHIFRVHTHIQGSTIPKWKKYGYYILDRLNSKFVDYYVPISNIVKDELMKKSCIDYKKIKIVYNGIPAMGNPDFFCDNAFLNKSIAIIGDIQKRKQQDLAVEALGFLHSKSIHINLHLIGRDREGYMSKVLASAQEQGVEHLVHFYGYQNKDKIYEIIKNIPVVILPSLFEGIPTSIIEGMSLRKIVIATSVGGTAELVENGVNGFLHPPKDSKALADILEKVFTTPAKAWESIKNAGYNTWKEKFSMEQMMGGLINVYSKLNLLDK